MTSGRFRISELVINDIELLSLSDRLQCFAQVGANVMTNITIAPEAERPEISDFTDVVNFLSDNGMINQKRFLAEMGPKQFRENMHSIHMSTLWAKYGFNVFNLTHGLAAGLMLTDPPEYRDGVELSLPFPCFAVLIPEGIVPVFVNSEQHWADMIWCYRFNSMHQGDKGKWPFFRWIATWKTVSVFRDRNALHLMIDKDESIYNLPTDPPVQDEDEITMQNSLRLIRNLILWLEATGGLKTRSPNNRPAKQTKNEKRWPCMWVLGREVKLARELREMAAETALSKTKHAKTGWRVRTKHIVRGHWKNQPHGEGRTLRKRLWVEPYYRGPEDAVAWSHLYKPET